MKQIATFVVPKEQEECNEFLRTNKTEQQFFNKDTMIFFYDNGVVSPEYEVSELRELLQSNINAKFNQSMAVFLMERQLADLQSEKSVMGYKKSSPRYDQIVTLINQLTANIGESKQAIAMQDIKIEFIEAKIAELQAQANK